MDFSNVRPEVGTVPVALTRTTRCGVLHAKASLTRRVEQVYCLHTLSPPPLILHPLSSTTIQTLGGLITSVFLFLMLGFFILVLFLSFSNDLLLVCHPGVTVCTA